MKIFSMIIGCLMLVCGCKEIKDTHAIMIYYIVAGLLMLFPLYLEFRK